MEKKLVLIFILLFIPLIFAVSSTNYNISSPVVAIGGNASSANYKSSMVLENIIGSISSSSYSQFLGFFFAAETNTAPAVSSVILNSTSGTNKTTEDLSVYYTSSDADGDSVTNITDWRKQAQSIAVLNMPFDTHIGSTESGAVRDYSTYGNNGTLGGGTSANVPTWTSSGKVGGAYEFDGVGDYVDCGNDESLDITNAITIEAWIKVSGAGSGFIVSKAYKNSGWAYRLFANSLTVIIFDIWTPSRVYITASINLNEWNHVVGVYDGEQIKLYVNGVLKSSDNQTGTIHSNNLPVLVGTSNDNSLSTFFDYFNGKIDEVAIYNYSLSAEQISANYQAGLAEHSPEIIVSNETAKNENWTCAVTPNDATEDGNTILSNELTILNTLPIVTLDSPEDENTTTDRTPFFSWSGSDDDGDSMTYDLNLTCYPGCSDDNRLIQSIDATSYVLTGYLKYLSDNNFYYNWTVRANDGDGDGAWATPRKIEIQSLIATSLLNSTISFGSLTMDATNNTADNNPLPFLMQNDGNCLLNTSINATNLWTAVSNPSDYFKYKVDNKSGEEGAFNWMQSQTSWAQMNSTPTIMIVQLNWSDVTDSFEVDLNVTVPPQEVAGNKESTVYFTSSLGE